MASLYFIVHLIILIIGIFMVAKHYKKGFFTPPVLSGIVFILLAGLQLMQ